MTETITTARISYIEEATYGVRAGVGVEATTNYIFGEHHQPIPIPTVQPAIVRRNSFSSYDANELKYGKKKVEFALPYLLNEGNVLEYVLGDTVSEGGSDDAYTHTFNGLAPADGTTLPSRTVHVEATGLTNAKYLDVCGAVIEELRLAETIGDNEIGVVATEKLVAQRITDENATSDMDGNASAGSEDDAIHHQAAEYRDTDISASDIFKITNLTYGGTSIVGSLNSYGIIIKNTLEKRYTRRNNKTDNYDNDLDNYIDEPLLRSRAYSIILNLLVDDDTISFYNNLLASEYDNDLVFTLTRGGSVSSTIVFTFDTSECVVEDISGQVNFTMGGNLGWTIMLTPKDLNSVVITDDIQNW